MLASPGHLTVVINGKEFLDEVIPFFKESIAVKPKSLEGMQ